MTLPRRDGLPTQIAMQIVQLACDRGFEIGAHLKEQHLAREFGVSRSPIRKALQLLEQKRVVRSEPNRGFFLTMDNEELEKTELTLGQRNDAARYMQRYMQIAEDRLDGCLPEEVNEAYLMRRYRVSRSQLVRMLTRMAQEGWVERKPGYGWAFLPVLTSPEALAQTYRFRIAIEPAAILEPTFKIDQTAFHRFRVKLKALLDGGIHDVSSPQLFEIGSTFHEMIVGCSGNPFFLEALQRQNRLRRLIDYRAMANTSHFVRQSREHIELMDRLEQRDRADAASFLRRHIEVAYKVKAKELSRARVAKEDENTVGLVGQTFGNRGRAANR